MSHEDQIPLFDEKNVSNSVKRFAFCFNIVAQGKEEYRSSESGYLLQQSVDLYRQITPDEMPTVTSPDEKAYLQIKFFEAGARMFKPMGWKTVESEAAQTSKSLMAKAVEMKIVQ